MALVMNWNEYEHHGRNVGRDIGSVVCKDLGSQSDAMLKSHQDTV